MEVVVVITVLEDWEKVHGKGSGYQLIEPVDGFHPNTVRLSSHSMS